MKTNSPTVTAAAMWQREVPLWLLVATAAATTVVNYFVFCGRVPQAKAITQSSAPGTGVSESGAQLEKSGAEKKGGPAKGAQATAVAGSSKESGAEKKMSRRGVDVDSGAEGADVGKVSGGDGDGDADGDSDGDRDSDSDAEYDPSTIRSEYSEEDGEEGSKMVLCVNMGLSMGKGKMAAQCGHATLGAFETACEYCPLAVELWQETGQAKIAVKVADDAAMYRVRDAARAKGIVAYVVRDEGRTQIAAGSRTVLALGPAPNFMFEGVTDKLKLL